METKSVVMFHLEIQNHFVVIDRWGINRLVINENFSVICWQDEITQEEHEEIVTKKRWENMEIASTKKLLFMLELVSSSYFDEMLNGWFSLNIPLSLLIFVESMSENFGFEILSQFIDN